MMLYAIFEPMQIQSVIMAGAVAVLAFSSCSRKIIPGKPDLATTAFALDSLPLSEINIPIRIDLKPVYSMAEKTVDTVFTSPRYPEAWVQSGCDTRYKYTFRRGPLHMSTAGNALNLGFTGYYRIIGSTRVCISGTAISPWTPPCRCGFEEPERRVNVSFSSFVSLQPDYKVKLSIRRNDPQPLDKCEVCFWGQDITKQVLNGLKEELDLSKAELEKNYGLVDLKPRFQQVWDELNKLYGLYDMGWLQINPQRLRISSLFARNDSLYVNLALAARPVISLEKPLQQNSWLPAMADQGYRPGFNIFMDAFLHYDSLSRILNSQLAGKTFDLNKGPLRKKFTVRNCLLYGADNEKLIIKIEFGGTDEGVLYLVGKPVYDAATKMLEVRNIDFDIRSKDAVLKAADWLFNKRIVTEISRHTRYDLSAYIDSAKAGINLQLNRQWMPGISSAGVIEDLSLVGIYPLTRYLVIRSNYSGNLAINVESLDFSL